MTTALAWTVITAAAYAGYGHARRRHPAWDDWQLELYALAFVLATIAAVVAITYTTGAGEGAWTYTNAPTPPLPGRYA